MSCRATQCLSLTASTWNNLHASSHCHLLWKTDPGQETACAGASPELLWDSLASPFICVVWWAGVRSDWPLAAAKQLNSASLSLSRVPVMGLSHLPGSWIARTSRNLMKFQMLCTSFNGDMLDQHVKKLLVGGRRDPMNAGIGNTGYNSFPEEAKGKQAEREKEKLTVGNESDQWAWKASSTFSSWEGMVWHKPQGAVPGNWKLEGSRSCKQHFYWINRSIMSTLAPAFQIECVCDIAGWDNLHP